MELHLFDQAETWALIGRVFLQALAIGALSGLAFFVLGEVVVRWPVRNRTRALRRGHYPW